MKYIYAQNSHMTVIMADEDSGVEMSQLRTDNGMNKFSTCYLFLTIITPNAIKILCYFVKVNFRFLRIYLKYLNKLLLHILASYVKAFVTDTYFWLFLSFKDEKPKAKLLTALGCRPFPGICLTLVQPTLNVGGKWNILCLE